jgi:RHS repeat-associated protein
LKRLNVSAAGRLLAVDEVQTDGSKVTSYLMADRQGSTRVLMNAAGAVTSRHDYFPFGEELGAGTGAPGSPTGMRTAAQGYSAADNVRQRYADTRLDDATGLDHTLWRKLETKSGRWTTPDPYGKSLRVATPQSFNRYSYVQNDPVNSLDPSGLDGNYTDIPLSDAAICRIFHIGCGDTGGSGSSGTGFQIVESLPDEPGGGTDPQKPSPEEIKSAIKDCLDALWGMGTRLDSFLPSEPGKDGKATFSYLKSLGEYASATITNDTRTYTAIQLTGLRGGPFPIVGGLTFPDHPYTNFTASDRSNFTGHFPGLDSAVGGFVATQIHELGNSIAAITGKDVGRTGAKDEDSGYQLEGCAARKLSGGL